MIFYTFPGRIGHFLLPNLCPIFCDAGSKTTPRKLCLHVVRKT